jgi:hypothetical protein
MSSRTKVRSVRGWDVGLAAAIAAVVLLGWLTAPASNGAAPHSGQLAGRGHVTGNSHVAPRPRGGNGAAAARPPALPHR